MGKVTFGACAPQKRRVLKNTRRRYFPFRTSHDWSCKETICAAKKVRAQEYTTENLFGGEKFLPSVVVTTPARTKLVRAGVVPCRSPPLGGERARSERALLVDLTQEPHEAQGEETEGGCT